MERKINIKTIVRKTRSPDPQCCARLVKARPIGRCSQPASYVINDKEFCTSHARAEVFDLTIAEYGIGAKQYG